MTENFFGIEHGFYKNKKIWGKCVYVDETID